MVAAEASVESSVETKPKSVRNPMELARSKALRQHDKHEQGEFRRELGVIIYNFDKKEQVLHTLLRPVAGYADTTSAPRSAEIVAEASSG